MTPAGPVTLLFTDLVNSTERLQRAGDEHAQRIFRAHHKLLKTAVAAHGGQEVKWLGDGLMAVFVSPPTRCVARSRCSRRRDGASRPNAWRSASACTSATRCATRRTTWVWRWSSRGACATTPRGGQILCSALVTGLLAGRQAFTFRDCGALALKGVAAPVAACEVLYQHDAPTALLTHTPFVGRRTELTKLTQKLQEARAGEGGLVLLAGEPGIGKTRTLEEFAELAGERGARVLSGRCYEGEWAPPYGPFAEALAVHAREANPEELRQDLGLGAAPLARLVSALREKLPDIPEPVALQPDEERFRLLDAVAQFLIALSVRTPVVLMLDDLHWADKGTIALLRHVARFAARNRILLLGGYRDVEVERTHPLAEALGALPRETRYEHLALSGLDTGEVAQLLETIADQEVPVALVTAIRAETSGNPFFIREVLLHLVEEGKILREDGRWTATVATSEMGIPESVRQVITRRLSHLSPEANRLLSVGSAFNGTFRFDIAARVAGLAEVQALDAIDEVLGAQLLVPSSQADVCDFTHALVRHTLYEQLSPPRQVRLHRQIAEAMEQTLGAVVGEHAAAVAEHYHRSKDLPGAERGVTHAVTAADRAEAVYAHDEVVRFLRIAAELTPRTAPRPARLLSRLALALTWVLNFDEAVLAAHEAGELIAATEGAAAAADYLGEAASNLLQAGSLQSAFPVAREGMAYIGARRDVTWLRLADIDVVRREQEDPEYPGIPLDCPERREMGVLHRSLSVRHSKRIEAPVIPLASRSDALHVLPPQAYFTWTGDFRGSLVALEEAATRCEREGRINSAAICLTGMARCRLALGDIAAADEAHARAVAFCDRLPLGSVGAFVSAEYTGDRCFVVNEGWAETFSMMVYAAEQPDPQNLFVLAAVQSAAAQALARLGQAEAAIQMLAPAAVALDRGPAWALQYTVLACNAADTLWCAERLDHAECVERNLRDKVIAADFRYPNTDGRLALAQLCALQGRYDEAVEWFAKARTVLDEQGARPMRAIVDYDEALMYVRRGGAGDTQRAAPLLEAALAQFRDIGMPGWIRYAEHLLREGREWKPSAQPSAGAPVQPPSFDSAQDRPGPLLGKLGKEGEAEPETRNQGPETRDRKPATNLFRREGHFWTIAYAGSLVRLRDTKGLQYLAHLLGHPGQEFLALDLVTVGSGQERRVTSTDTIPLLDAQAKAEYRARLEDLREELVEAEGFNDLGRIEKLQAEMQCIGAQLSAAVGLHGNDRKAGASAERARLTVTKRIKDALNTIAKLHPLLAHHLRGQSRIAYSRSVRRARISECGMRNAE
jgi:tetratricopeptide (TPR) repeat protein